MGKEDDEIGVFRQSVSHLLCTQSYIREYFLWAARWYQWICLLALELCSFFLLIHVHHYDKFKIQQSKTALNHALNADARNNPAPYCDPGLPFCQGWKYNVGSHVKSEFQQLKGWTVHLLHNGTLVWSLTLGQVSSFSTEPTNYIVPLHWLSLLSHCTLVWW